MAADAPLVLAATRTLPRERDADPLAGEDEPWAADDFRRSPDAEDYVRLWRTLWIAAAVGALLWFSVVVSGARLLMG